MILQQTRIAQGTPYYERFIAAYPDIGSLAGATEEEVLKLWQGLGYYSRARNMHQAARSVVERYAGEFPATWSELRKLKGVGEYTAAAIASICFGEPQPVVDGNVIRFFARYFGIEDPVDRLPTRKRIHSLALERIDPENPGDFNQAMMEFGAMVCTPANPGCANCPFKESCIAWNKNLVEKIPVRHASRVTRHRYIHYAVITFRRRGEEFICLNKRTGDDIWRNLYDFPSVESAPLKPGRSLKPIDFAALFNGPVPEFCEVSEPVIHVLTHQRIHARFYRFRLPPKPDLPFLCVPVENITGYPVPRLVEKFIQQYFLST